MNKGSFGGCCAKTWENKRPNAAESRLLNRAMKHFPAHLGEKMKKMPVQHFSLTFILLSVEEVQKYLTPF